MRRSRVFGLSLQLATCAAGSALLVAAPADAAPPIGFLDRADTGQIAGWASDPDFPGPIQIHIYIDGVLHRAILADSPRADVGAHAYAWVPPPLGAGTHSVIAYGIGVDARGVPDGENVGLTGSPRAFSGGCSGLTGSAFVWCRDNPGYWIHRPSDTLYLSNDDVRFGVDRSYGGTIFELYDDDWNDNLITEHGGAAMQLSLWGYDPVGPDAFFREGVCDPTPYASCPAGASCLFLCCSRGAHVADCTSTRSCAFTAGAPFNPIQAQGADCGWENAGNDVSTVGVHSSPPWIHITKDAPQQFTKSDAFGGMHWEQVASLLPAGIQVDYRITYSGPYTLNAHDQEIPALYPAADMHDVYYWYEGGAPWTHARVSSARPTDWRALRLAGHPEVCDPGEVMGTTSEGWVSTCNAAGTRCMTVLTFSPDVGCYSCSGSGNRAYLTPKGHFPIVPGLDKRITIYVFPYRYDHVVAGRTIRDHIYDIAAGRGCAAYGMPCDDMDPCTRDDTCDGLGTCRGVSGSCAPPDAGREPTDAGAVDGGSAATDGGGAMDGGDEMDGGGSLDAGEGADAGGSTSPPASPPLAGGCGCRAASKTGRRGGRGAAVLLVCAALALLRRRMRGVAPA